MADDLLKNDGRKFIEMMEQLAERRMQREEDAAYHSVSHQHNPGLDESIYDEDEEDDYDSQEEEDDEYIEDDDVRNALNPPKLIAD